jgi:AbrB family looped-hinge helix DNA binding protein
MKGEVKTRGVSRPIDNLGRIVIPKEIRNEMKLAEGSRMEVCYGTIDNKPVVWLVPCEDVPEK